MLSFFAKKTKNPDTPTEEIIQGPTEPQQNGGGDDFIFVEKKTPDNDPARPPQHHMGMYPPMPAGYGMGPYPGARFYPPVPGAMDGGAAFAGPIPYVQGVPFELAPQLCTKSAFEITQLQVDGILAMLTRQMSVEEQDEYNFTLERSIQNECY